MFDSSFPFSLIQRKSKNTDYLQAEYVVQFRTSKRRYIVIAELYELNVYAVKFFPADKKSQDNRFSIVLNDFDFAPIIRTCINIMLQLLEGNPLASFAYIGAHTISENYKESKVNTTRYRIYEYVKDAFLSPSQFKRYFSKKNSAMLLLNKNNEAYEVLAEKMIEMFTDLYDELEPL